MAPGPQFGSGQGSQLPDQVPHGALAVGSICRPPEGVCVPRCAHWPCVWLRLAQTPTSSLFQVRQQLSEMKSHVEDGDVAGSPAAPPAEQDPIELKTQLEQTEATLEGEQALRQKLSAELEEAQSSACRLQAELDKLRSTGFLESSEAEEVTQLKERLEKEKKLTSDLGRAATKLQELLKTTQDQLTKEKETVQKLQEQLDKTEDGSSSKEGTSV